ncbi:MAG TPA: hypothetical protein VKZ85_12840 [Woeseiaceae bacterium]|nr:hypothetical protein [Woeseiaceae bacterium]
MPRWRIVLASASLALGAVGTAGAGPVEDLLTFTAGTPAKADEVNANFAAVAEAVNDNDARIAALEAEIAELRQQLTNALNIDPYLSLETVNGQPAIRVTGANLQLVNGLGETRTANGTGNLLIGYDEARGGGSECSIGFDVSTSAPVTNEEECNAAGGVWAVSHKSGSHYLVVGSEHNYTRWGGIVVGYRNTTNFDFASVSGGRDSSASAFAASISGGWNNRARGMAASVGGGANNSATGQASSVAGGADSSANGLNSSVAGGLGNQANGAFSAVGGGAHRSAEGSADWVAGSLFEDH